MFLLTFHVDSTWVTPTRLPWAPPPALWFSPPGLWYFVLRRSCMSIKFIIQISEYVHPHDYICQPSDLLYLIYTCKFFQRVDANINHVLCVSTIFIHLYTSENLWGPTFLRKFYIRKSPVPDRKGRKWTRTLNLRIHSLRVYLSKDYLV